MEHILKLNAIICQDQKSQYSIRILIFWIICDFVQRCKPHIQTPNSDSQWSCYLHLDQYKHVSDSLFVWLKLPFPCSGFLYEFGPFLMAFKQGLFYFASALSVCFLALCIFNANGLTPTLSIFLCSQCRLQTTAIHPSSCLVYINPQ